MPLPAQSYALVGGAHRNADGSNRMDEIFRCEPGEEVDLYPEPENPFDRHAIAVFSCRGVQIGYISAERAPRLGALLASREVKAAFQRPTTFGAWLRVAFDGEVPTITEAMLEDYDEPEAERAQDEPEFYPDENWPED